MATSSETQFEETDSERWAFYSILMVDRKATESEINTAYKRLSLQFHPDKHTSPESKKAAENLFHRIKRAKDVLCDPHLRRIYDAVGPDGLEEFQNAQLIQKDMRSSKEVIDEYKRLLEFKRFQDEISSYNPHAGTSIHVDMCSLFEHDYYGTEVEDDITIIDRFASVEITKMSLRQGFTFPIGTEDHVSINSSLLGNFENRNKTSGNFSLLWQRQLPYGIIGNAGLVIGQSSQLSLSFSKSPSKYSLLNGGLACDVFGDTIFPSYHTTYSRQISKKLRAEISGKVGLLETVKFNLYYNSEAFSVMTSLQTGIQIMNSDSPTALSLRFTKHFPSHHLSVRVGGKLSLTKQSVTVGCKKVIPDKQLSFNSELKLDSRSGILLHLSCERGRQKYEVPILISSRIEPVAAGYSLLIPVAAYAVVQSLLIIPYLQQQKELKLKKKKEEERERLAARKMAALEEINLMSAAVEQIISVEQSKSGLLIVKALYGKLQLIEQGEGMDDSVINVTIALQHQVKNSALKLPMDTSKVAMPGFYDPCYGEQKSLYIRYKFHDRLHHVTVADDEPVCIPRQGHLIGGNSNS